MIEQVKKHPFLVIFAGLFTGLAFLVASGNTITFDETGLLLLRNNNDPNIPIGGLGQASIIGLLTHAGDSITLAIITVFIVGFLYHRKEKDAARWFLIAATGSFILTALSKYLFGRDRPDIVEQFANATSGSFPSGHTLRSAVVYTLIAFMLAQTRFYDHKKTVAFLAVIIIGVNGISRVYLGVHWPTDIIGAWLIAGFWLLLCKNGYDRSCSKKENL